MNENLGIKNPSLVISCFCIIKNQKIYDVLKTPNMLFFFNKISKNQKMNRKYQLIWRRKAR